LLLFEVIDRVLRVPAERRIQLLKEKLLEKEKEAYVLRQQITDLEQLVARGDKTPQSADSRDTGVASVETQL
jgi:hypothetical protein